MRGYEDLTGYEDLRRSGRKTTLRSVLSSSPKIITVLVFHNFLTTNIVCFRNPKSKFRNVLMLVVVALWAC